MPAHLCCSCGRPLRIRVRRDGVVFRCEEHGIVWRFVVNVQASGKPPAKAKEGEDRRADRK